MENNFTVLNKLLYLIKFLIMKLKGFTNLKLAELLESATNLFVNKKYQSKKEVEDNLGLLIQRSYFYGKKQTDGEYVALSLSTVTFDSKNDVQLVIEGIVVLPKTPVNNGDGDITYTGYGVLEVDGVVVYDGRSAKLSGGLQESINGADSQIDFSEKTLVISKGDSNTYIDGEAISTSTGYFKHIDIDPGEDNDVGHMELTPRTLINPPVANQVEYDGEYLYITNSSASERKKIPASTDKPCVNFTNWTVSEDNNIDLSEKSVLDLNNIVVTGGNKTFNIPTAKNDIENIFEIKFETGATVPTIIFNFATANTSLKKNYSTIPTNSRIRLIITQSKSGVGFWNSEINLIQFAN